MTTFEHELPVAAIPKGSTVDASGIEDCNWPELVIREVLPSTPRAGLITWVTDHGRQVVSATRRVPVNLPTTRSEKGATSELNGTSPRRRRR